MVKIFTGPWIEVYREPEPTLIPICSQIVCRSVKRPVMEPTTGITGEVTGASSIGVPEMITIWDAKCRS